MIAFIGVLISKLIDAKKSDFTLFADSALSLSLRKSVWSVITMSMPGMSPPALIEAEAV